MNKLEQSHRKCKYSSYQEYVFQNGKFIGDFESMYKDFDDPWNQTTREEFATDKAITLNLIKKFNFKRVIELGCGLGHFTNKIREIGVDVLGVDISKTAIEKARTKHPNGKFLQGDILDFEIYKRYNPDLIIMAEITWYVLEKLDDFLEFFKSEMKNVFIIHLLVTYPKGVQKYGCEKFTNLDQILSYFKFDFFEYGEIFEKNSKGCKRTFFIGKPNA